MPRKRNDEPEDAIPEGFNRYTLTCSGQIKGHPPISMTALGRTPKEAMNNVRVLLFRGKLKIELA
jgi:hypothetical protein